MLSTMVSRNFQARTLCSLFGRRLILIAMGYNSEHTSVSRVLGTRDSETLYIAWNAYHARVYRHTAVPHSLNVCLYSATSTRPWS